MTTSSEVGTAETLNRIREWTHVFGRSLCPETTNSADTYGDGMRAAKAQVRMLLNIIDKEKPK